jgi:hypothetical protein
MIDFNSPNENIPFIAYTLIGITSLVLTYATMMDNEPDKEGESAVDMLPSNEEAEKEVEKEPEVAVAEPIGSVAPEPNAPPVPVVPVNPLIPAPPLESLNSESSEKKELVGGRKTKQRSNKNKKTRRNKKH